MSSNYLQIVYICDMKNKQKTEQRFKLLLKKIQADDYSPLELDEIHILLNEEAFSSEIKNKMSQELNKHEYSELAAFNVNKSLKNIELQLDRNRPKRKRSNSPFLYRTISEAALILLLIVVSGLTAYFFNEKTTIDKQLSVSYCEVVAPMGANSQVILPDGSVVWLNAGSKLTYSTNFNLDNRLVHLEGEGYFQVAKNRKQLFVVDAFGFLVEGDETEFNVKAYREEPTIEAILVEGKVWINHRTDRIASDVSLDRKYKATFYKQTKGSVLNPAQPRLVISPNVDPRPLISWKERRFTDQTSQAPDHFRMQSKRELAMLFDFEKRKGTGIKF